MQVDVAVLVSAVVAMAVASLKDRIWFPILAILLAIPAGFAAADLVVMLAAGAAAGARSTDGQGLWLMMPAALLGALAGACIAARRAAGRASNRDR